MGNLNEMKKGFEKINSKIGATIEMTPDVYEILGTLYNEEEVLVKAIEVVTNNEYKVRCVFPEYRKTKEASNHVSAIQMAEAVMHAAFMVIGLYIKNNPDKAPIDFDKFLQIRMDAKYVDMHNRFTKIVKPGENTYLSFHNVTITKKKGFYIATVQLKGTSETFVRGESGFVLEDKYV